MREEENSSPNMDRPSRARRHREYRLRQTGAETHAIDRNSIEPRDLPATPHEQQPAAERCVVEHVPHDNCSSERVVERIRHAEEPAADDRHKLRKVVADLSLDKEMLQDALRRKL